METQATSSGHGKRKRTGKNGKKQDLMHRVQAGLSQIDRRSISQLWTRRRAPFAGIERLTSGWIARNPKSAFGLALSAGILIGAMARNGLARSSLSQLGSYLRSRFA